MLKPFARALTKKNRPPALFFIEIRTRNIFFFTWPKYRYKNKTLEINIYKYKCVQNCYNFYSVKTLANKWVLSFLNDSTDWSTFLLANRVNNSVANGNEFHRAGAAEENARISRY